MALQDPSAPWAPGAWDDYINAFQPPADIGMAPAVDPVTQQLLPGELAKHQGGEGGQPLPPPPPPPPPPTQSIEAGRKGGSTSSSDHGAQQFALGVPTVAEEVAQNPAGGGLLTPPLLGAPDQPPDVPPMITPDAHAPSLPGFGASIEQPIADAKQKFENLSDEDYGKFLSHQSLDQQEAERAKIEGARQKFATAHAVNLADKTLREAEDNARIRQDSIKASQDRGARLDVEAKQLADENPLDSISGTRKVLGVLAAIVGGFAANKTGRNMGLEAVDQIANDAAQQHAQKLQLNARQRAQVGDEIGQVNDAYHASETVRLAVYDGMAKKLETEVQNFDPRGTTALRVMDDINQIKAKRAALLAKYQTDQQGQIEKALKLQLEAQKAAEDQRHNMAGEKNDAVRAGADYLRATAEKDKAKGEAQLLPPEYFAQTYPNVDPSLLPKAPATEKQFQQRLEASGKAQQITNNSLATTNALPGITVKGKDGNAAPFIALGRPEDVEKLRMRSAKLKELVSLIDDARRTRSGWTTDLGNAKEHQELKAIWGKAKIAAKDYFQLGAITKQDEPLIVGSLGAEDPSQMRDPLAGMEKARGLLVKDFGRDLVEHGYPEDQHWDIPDLQKNAPTITPEQFDLKFVLDPSHGTETGPRENRKVVMSDKQKEIVDNWVNDLDSPDEAKRVRAAQFLGQAADKASLSTIKTYARAALDRAASPSNIKVTEELEP